MGEAQSAAPAGGNMSHRGRSEAERAKSLPAVNLHGVSRVDFEPFCSFMTCGKDQHH